MGYFLGEVRNQIYLAVNVTLYSYKIAPWWWLIDFIYRVPSFAFYCRSCIHIKVNLMWSWLCQLVTLLLFERFKAFWNHFFLCIMSAKIFARFNVLPCILDRWQTMAGLKENARVKQAGSHMGTLKEGTVFSQAK
jgi:hypothetical protein